MEIDSFTTGKAVKALLDKMALELPHRRWEALVTRSDGQGRTLIEVNVYRRDGQELAGRISYQLETGEVIDAFYPGFEGEFPATVIDLLLDVVDLESRIATMEHG
jgi:hypothetical protein